MIASALPAAVAPEPGPRPGPNPSHPYLDPVNRIDTLLAAIARALDGPERATPAQIHGVRKRLKEMRALLRLFGRPGDAARKAAGQLADALASARDATAALDALALLNNSSLPRATRTAMRETLQTSRVEHETATAAADTAALLRSIDAAWQAYRPASPDAATLRRRLVRTYRRTRRDAPDARTGTAKPREAWRRSSPVALHDLRKRVIILRYQLELARPLAPRRIARWIDALQTLRDRLGDVQDLEVLAETPAWREYPTPHPAEALDRARNRAINRAHHAFRRLFRARPRDIRKLLAFAESRSPAA